MDPGLALAIAGAIGMLLLKFVRLRSVLLAYGAIVLYVAAISGYKLATRNSEDPASLPEIPIPDSQQVRQPHSSLAPQTLQSKERAEQAPTEAPQPPSIEKLRPSTDTQNARDVLTMEGWSIELGEAKAVLAIAETATDGMPLLRFKVQREESEDAVIDRVKRNVLLAGVLCSDAGLLRVSTVNAPKLHVFMYGGREIYSWTLDQRPC
jgi:hypothetical protein